MLKAGGHVRVTGFDDVVGARWPPGCYWRASRTWIAPADRPPSRRGSTSVNRPRASVRTPAEKWCGLSREATARSAGRRDQPLRPKPTMASAGPAATSGCPCGSAWRPTVGDAGPGSRARAPRARPVRWNRTTRNQDHWFCFRRSGPKPPEGGINQIVRNSSRLIPIGHLETAKHVRASRGPRYFL